MGKVVGVLRSSHQVSRAHHKDNHLDNHHDIDDDDDGVAHLDTVNENAATASGSASGESMVLAATRGGGGGCASCAAAAAAAKSPKPGSGELDDSLCGDPLMYATFVAPVHQYSTETEPSRQTSFNYPSRQPSFKQNSSEAEPHAEFGYPPQFLGGQLPVPRCSSSGSADLATSDDVRDIYEEVPTLDRWPLPPLPAEDVCSVEVSQDELERQLHMERMSFMSGSSANDDDEEEEMFDEKDNSLAAMLPPPPPPPMKSSLHLGQPSYACRNSRDLNVSPTVYESYRPVTSVTLQRHWLSGEDSDGGDVTSAGTVRRKAKRERNKTTTGVLVTKDFDGLEVLNSASVSPACSAPNVNKSNSFKRAKPARSKCPSEAPPPTPPPPVPPHQNYYKTPTVLEGPARPAVLTGRSVGRLASPDQFSESSASFHENEFAGGHEQQQQQQQKRTPNVAADVHHHHYHAQQQQLQQQQQRRLHQQRRRTPPPPQFCNRDSVRESWMSSGSECQGSSGSAQGGILEDSKSVHYHQRVQPHQPPVRPVLPATNLGRGSKSHRDLLLHHQNPKPVLSSTTLPRPSR
jgi:hypothetical protein